MIKLCWSGFCKWSPALPRFFHIKKKFARITPINHGNRLCFRINRIKKEKINIKSEEPLKNLKTSSGSSPDLCLSNHPKMNPKYLVRQSLKGRPLEYLLVLMESEILGWPPHSHIKGLEMTSSLSLLSAAWRWSAHSSQLTEAFRLWPLHIMG